VNWSSVLRGQGRHVCRRVASCPLRNPGSSQARPYPTSRAPLPDLQFQHKGNPRPQEVHHQKGGLGAGRGGCRLFLSTPALPGAPGRNPQLLYLHRSPENSNEETPIRSSGGGGGGGSPVVPTSRHARVPTAGIGAVAAAAQTPVRLSPPFLPGAPAPGAYVCFSLQGSQLSFHTALPGGDFCRIHEWDFLLQFPHGCASGSGAFLSQTLVQESPRHQGEVQTDHFRFLRHLQFLALGQVVLLEVSVLGEASLWGWGGATG
jgi:hypothetical protein